MPAYRLIAALEQTGEAISFPAVARHAGVSVSLLYTDTDLAARIATGRDRQRQAGGQRAWQLPVRSLVTEQGLRAELANTKEQVRQLGADADNARDAQMSPLLDRLEERRTRSRQPPAAKTDRPTGRRYQRAHRHDRRSKVGEHRLLHHCDVLSVNGPSYRPKDRLNLVTGGEPMP